MCVAVVVWCQCMRENECAYRSSSNAICNIQHFRTAALRLKVKSETVCAKLQWRWISFLNVFRHMSLERERLWTKCSDISIRKKKQFRRSDDRCTIWILAGFLNGRLSWPIWTQFSYKFKYCLSIYALCERLTAKKGAISLMPVCHVWHSILLFSVIHEINVAYVLSWWSRHYSHSRCKFNVHENYCCASNTWGKI